MKTTRVIHVLSLGVLLASLFGPLGVQPAAAGGGGIAFTVNSAADDPDVNGGDGICQTYLGKCTLRAAIMQSNALSDPNTIYFNLPGTGMHVIFVQNGVLPAIIYQLNIMADSQPNCAAPCVVLSGVALTTATTFAGLHITTDYALVRGLVITSFTDYGIWIEGNGNRIQGNIIGFWPGVGDLLGNGIGISVTGADNLIGGTAAGDRNVISGNEAIGISVETGSTWTAIQGNYIGTDQTGTRALGNGTEGIEIYGGATNTLVGGTTTAARNVISGNGWIGISVVGDDTVIEGNFIGLKASGKGALGNGADGVYVQATGVTIGGATNATRNRIANNSRKGVAVATGQATIRRNIIFHNGSLGIDLGMDNVTANDVLDVDTGPNDLQNYPVLTSATSGTLTIVGKLNSKMSAAYVIEFFSSPAGSCDLSGHGEGAKFLGLKSVTTDGTGLAKFKFVSAVPFAAGNVITATATDSAGNTSEFSACRTAG